MRFKLPILLTLLVIALSIPNSSMAERFTDLYIGAAFSEDIKISYQDAQGNAASGKIDFNHTFVLGYRIGYWFDRAPWLGISLEASYFSHDIDAGYLTVVPVSPLLMFRIPLLKNNRYPTGEWQPYTAIGPGFFYSKLAGGNQGDDEVDIGLDARAGLKKMLLHNFGVFIEYRFTYFSPSYSRLIDDTVDIRTHHAFAGISVDF